MGRKVVVLVKNNIWLEGYKVKRVDKFFIKLLGIGV